MAVLIVSLGILCIGYYLCSVTYAGFGVSMIWIWLLGGIALIGLGTAMLYCKKQGIGQEMPFALRCVLKTILVSIAALFLIMEGLIFSGMNQKGEPNLDYLIVLGCQVKGNGPSKSLRERLDTAKEYMEQNPQTKAILSGGQGRGENISEAACMFQYLTEQGVDPARLIMEDKSTTTVENLDFSRAFLDEGKEKIGLVTNNFHIYRSVRIAKKAGYKNVCGIAAPSRTMLLPHYLVREFLALSKEEISH